MGRERRPHPSDPPRPIAIPSIVLFRFLWVFLFLQTLKHPMNLTRPTEELIENTFIDKSIESRSMDSSLDLSVLGAD